MKRDVACFKGTNADFKVWLAKNLPARVKTCACGRRSNTHVHEMVEPREGSPCTYCPINVPHEHVFEVTGNEFPRTIHHLV